MLKVTCYTLTAYPCVTITQVRVARALYWGHQGLKRNLGAAVEYYKMGADTGDPQSQYDYGIALMKVRWLLWLFVYLLL